MSDPLKSRSTIPEILSELPGTRRVDDEGDLLACRVAGDHPTRTAYIYLYGGNPDVISFDLEDEVVDSGTWDNAVRRGEAKSITELQEAVSGWLNPSGTETE